MIEDVKKLFSRIRSCSVWTLDLLRVSEERGKAKYAACHITLDPPGSLREYVASLLEQYYQGKKPILDNFSSCSDYDGYFMQETIYRLSSSSELVSQQFAALTDALADPVNEANPLEFDATAYVLSTTLDDLDGEQIPIKLFSIQAPLTKMKHRFLHDSNTFREIEDKVLCLKESVDVLIFGNVIYFLNMKGENLFAMDRAYRATCGKTIEEIRGMDICSNYSLFESTAMSGFNPRRFITFNRSRLKILSNPDTRSEKAAMFQLEVGADGRINTSDKTNAEKLIKVLCKKGMYDPFEEVPVEVPTSRKW